MENNICPHCLGNIEIKNPTGNCDHSYYPDNCPVCLKRWNQESDPIQRLQKSVDDLCEKIYELAAEKQLAVDIIKEFVALDCLAVDIKSRPYLASGGQKHQCAAMQFLEKNGLLKIRQIHGNNAWGEWTK